jgi:hypothetical protein
LTLLKIIANWAAGKTRISESRRNKSDAQVFASVLLGGGEKAKITQKSFLYSNAKQPFQNSLLIAQTILFSSPRQCHALP